MENCSQIFNIIKDIYMRLIKENFLKVNNILAIIINHLFKTYLVKIN